VTEPASSAGRSAGGEPSFDEPWQAEVFAIVEALLDAGRFSPAEWTAALSSAITAAQRAGDPDEGDTYYEHWFAALEALCGAKGLLTTTELDQLQDAWRAAYQRTPHGQPVELPDGAGRGR
jgi:nitrile hydratase accessory protein